MKKTYVLLTALLMLMVSIRAAEDPQKIIKKVKDNFSSIKDYQVDVNIKVDVDILKVPEMNAVMYFKQPDKMKMDSKGFAMLPKQAFSFAPGKLLGDNTSAIYLKDEDLSGNKCAVIRIVPNDMSGELLISTVWIDKNKNIIRKIASSGKRGDTEILFSYDTSMKYPLPSSVRFSFDAPNLNRRNNDQQGQKAKQSSGKGTAVIRYKNYRVNQGLSDKIFDKK